MQTLAGDFGYLGPKPDYQTLNQDLGMFAQNETGSFYWRKYRIENLKDDLNAYIAEIDGQINLHDDLTEQFEFVRQLLSSLAATPVNKSSTIGVIESFQNQLVHLLNRLSVTENFVLQLAKFFSLMFQNDTQYANEKFKRKSRTLKTHKQIQKVAKQAKRQKEPIATQQTYGFNQQILPNYANQYTQQKMVFEDMSDASSDQCSLPDEEPIGARRAKQRVEQPFVSPYNLDNVVIPVHETTDQIAKNVKEFLIVNKISQKTFAENLLQMKQANLSALLSTKHMTPWESLSPMLKKRFSIMYLWLHDEHRMQKLSPPPPPPPQQLLMNEPLNDFANKQRNLLSTKQSEALRNYFAKTQYPLSEEIVHISNQIELPVLKVSNWFKNQRQLKKTRFKI